jgi:hypothetical protein
MTVAGKAKIAVLANCVVASAAGAGGSVHAAKSISFPPRLELLTQTRWGYGCGGNCAFNHTGESKVSVGFGADGTVRVTDAGNGEVQANHPDGVTYTTRRWDFERKGGWKDEGGTRVLSLGLESSRCTETTSNAAKREQRPCQPKAGLITVACAVETVRVHSPVPSSAKRGEGQDVKAVVCRASGEAAGAGTEFPWVFGTERPIKTLKAGEPRPEVFYSVEAGPGALKN